MSVADIGGILQKLDQGERARLAPRGTGRGESQAQRGLRREHAERDAPGATAQVLSSLPEDAAPTR